MPTVETSTWLALKGRVASLVLSPALPIAWPNEAFSPPSGAYLRATWVPNITRRILIGSAGPHQRLSLLQIDVFRPLDEPAAIALEIAGQVAAHFPTDLRMKSYDVTARVTEAPLVAQPIPNDTHLQVPVTVQIEVFA